jgi:hypothetical protein
VADIQPWAARAILWSFLAGALNPSPTHADEQRFPTAGLTPGYQLEDQSMNDTERRAAENLMMRIQAKAYAQGKACSCPPRAFISPQLQKESAVDQYVAADLVQDQAMAYATGGIHLPVITHCTMNSTLQRRSDMSLRIRR